MAANILLVEYEQRYVERVRGALAQTGNRLEVAGDLDKAVEICAHIEPQLVIITSVLPRLQIEDAITQLRGRAGLRLTPFLILMSGYGGSEPATDAIKYGAQDILERPFTAEALVFRVESLLALAVGSAATQAIPQDTLDALRRSAGLTGGDQSLTSDELFGDIVSDVERDVEAVAPIDVEPGDPAPAAPLEPPPQDPFQPPPDTSDGEVERALAEVFADSKIVSPIRRPPPSSERDVDEILSETLAGLDVNLAGVKAARAQGSGPSTPSEAPQQSSAFEDETPPEDILFDPSVIEESPPFEDAAEGFEVATPATEQEPEDLESAPDEHLEADTPVSLDDVELMAPEPDRDLEAMTPEPDEEPEATPEEPDSGTEPSLDVPPASSGTRFGQYILEEHIATGGMAEVYRARMMGMEGFQKTVAIKRVLSHLAGNKEFVTMLIDEAKLAAQLNHNNIIHIYDLGKLDRSYYIAMEYIEGKDLRSLLGECKDQGVTVPIPLALYIATLLASALDYAHKKRDFENRDLGLVHRDVSPQNVLISDDGDIKLCDFGIAKAASKATQTRAGALKGKLQYMSPEQAWGKDLDHRSDIFSLGLVLYEMLTGSKVFTGSSEMSVLEQVRDPKVSAPSKISTDVTNEIDRIVLKALEPDRERRYQAARDLQRDLEGVLRARGWSPDPAAIARYIKDPSSTDALVTPAAAVAPDAPAEKAAEEKKAAPEAVALAESEPVEDGVETVAEPPPGGGSRRLWWLAAMGVVMIGVIGGGSYLFRDGLPDFMATPTPVPAVVLPTNPTPTPTPETDDLLVKASALAEEELARQDEDLRRRLEQEFPTPTPLPPTDTPTDTPTVTDTPTETPTPVPPTATRVPPTATPIPPTPTPSVREGDIVDNSSAVVAPVIIHRVEPEYPRVALQMRLGGSVEAEALVGIDGRVEDVRIVSVSRSSVGFEKATEDAILQWRYKPATKNGVKVRVWVIIHVPFRYR